MYNKIILPTDGSGYSEEEVERATKLVSDEGEIVILSVAGKITSSAFQRRSNVQKLNKELREEAHKNVKNMERRFEDKVNVRTKVVVGFPAEKINEVASDENADLIIISSSGKSGLHRFIIGSVAEKVLKTSDIDVLLVHSK